jgi:hypothetical protein
MPFRCRWAFLGKEKCLLDLLPSILQEELWFPYL